MIHLTKRPFILKKHDMVDDPNASSRKSDHINLTFQSQTNKSNIDSRFYYEPLFQGNPSKDIIPKFELAKKIMNDIVTKKLNKIKEDGELYESDLEINSVF